MILTVDDSQSIRQLVTSILDANKFKSVSAIHGEDALRYFDGRHIDLLLTDLHMPVMDGITLIKEVRKMKNYQYMPILFFTTESNANKKREARDLGATGWIVKPCDEDKLISVIQKVVRR